MKKLLVLGGIVALIIADPVHSAKVEAAYEVRTLPGPPV